MTEQPLKMLFSGISFNKEVIYVLSNKIVPRILQVLEANLGIWLTTEAAQQSTKNYKKIALLHGVQNDKFYEF